MLRKVISSFERYLQSDGVAHILLALCKSGVGTEGGLHLLLDRAFAALEKNDRTFRAWPRRERTEDERRYDFLLRLQSEKVVLEVKHVRSVATKRRQAMDLARQLKETRNRTAMGTIFITGYCRGRSRRDALRTDVEKAARTFLAWLAGKNLVELAEFGVNVSEEGNYGYIRTIFIGEPRILWRVKPGFYRVVFDFGTAGTPAEVAGRYASVAELICADDSTAVFFTEDVLPFVDAVLEEDKFADIECLTEDERLRQELAKCADRIFQQKR